MVESDFIPMAIVIGWLIISVLVMMWVSIKIQRRMTEPSIQRLLLVFVAGFVSFSAAIMAGMFVTTGVQALFGDVAAAVLPWPGVAAMVVWFARNLKRSDLFPDRPPVPPVPRAPASRPRPVPPVVRKGRPAAHETIDVIFDYPLDRTNFGEIQFEYENLKGELGTRRVRVQEFLYNGFKGYDLGKRGPRQFNYRGIQGGTVTLLDTGEILPVREWVTELAAQK